MMSDGMKMINAKYTYEMVDDLSMFNGMVEAIEINMIIENIEKLIRLIDGR